MHETTTTTTTKFYCENKNISKSISAHSIFFVLAYLFYRASPNPFHGSQKARSHETTQTIVLRVGTETWAASVDDQY